MIENKRFENRLNKDIKKFHALNPVWDNEKQDALNVFEMIDLLNEGNNENEQLKKENKELKQQVEDLYENDKSLREMMSNMTHNFQGISVKEELFNEVLKILKEIKADDLYDDLYKTSINTGVNGC